VGLTERLVFLGEIDRTHDFEGTEPMGRIVEGGAEADDFLLDDTAMAYTSADGLVIVTGCSHSGICNIADTARRVCREERVADIVGGLHLLTPTARQLQGTLAYLAALRPGHLHACHCTDLASKIALSRAADVREVGVGLTLDYPEGRGLATVT
jgi:7,8-dihydropterin-6-yl-methyl-4-(beta-D-ribofuranosyl)aminobenzene 5'-phosphate synthase